MSILYLLASGILGLVFITCASSAIGFALCFFVALLGFVWRLVAWYLVMAAICVCIAWGAYSLVDHWSKETNGKSLKIAKVVIIFPGIIGLTIIPNFLSIGMQQTAEAIRNRHSS